MTIYAFRIYQRSDPVLVEFKSAKEMSKASATARPGQYYELTSVTKAHAHVKAGRIHETALWLDDGRIRRADDGR